MCEKSRVMRQYCTAVAAPDNKDYVGLGRGFSLFLKGKQNLVLSASRERNGLYGRFEEDFIGQL